MNSALLLAAGRGSRMQDTLKPLLEVEGQTMLARALDFLAGLKLGEIVVVLGYQAEAIEPHVTRGRVVYNPAWEEGMASSIRTGVEALSSQSQAVLIMPVDLPELRDHEVGRQVLQAPGPIAAPVHRGRRGHPVRFDRCLYPELLQLEGDRGAAALLDRHPVSLVEVETPAIYRDRDSRPRREKGRS